MHKYQISIGRDPAKWLKGAHPVFKSSSQPSGQPPRGALRLLSQWKPPGPSLKPRDLPLSPLMDPKLLASKQKHHLRKPLPSKNPEAFQRQLAKNPYALALATPVRRCQLTRVALPKYFLQDFTLMRNPKTNIVSYVPRSLAAKSHGRIQVPMPDSRDRATEDKTIENVMKRSHPEPEAPVELEIKVSGLNLPHHFTPTRGGTGHIHSRYSILRAIQDQKGYLRSLNFSSGDSILFSSGMRPDMHDFALKLMRRRIVESLQNLAELKRGYLVGCSGWEDAMKKPQVAAFLYTGREEEPSARPTEFATLDITRETLHGSKNRKVPVHNLRALLGEDMLGELLAKTPSGLFGMEIITLRHKNATVDAQMRLWKLQGYLAEYQ